MSGCFALKHFLTLSYKKHQCDNERILCNCDLCCEHLFCCCNLPKARAGCWLCVGNFLRTETSNRKLELSGEDYKKAAKDLNIDTYRVEADVFYCCVLGCGWKRSERIINTNRDDQLDKIKAKVASNNETEISRLKAEILGYKDMLQIYQSQDENGNVDLNSLEFDAPTAEKMY